MNDPKLLEHCNVKGTPYVQLLCFAVCLVDSRIIGFGVSFEKIIQEKSYKLWQQIVEEAAF